MKRSIYENKSFVNALDRLTIIEGCAKQIAADTKNTLDARSKGRLIQRDIEDVRQLLRESIGAVIVDRDSEAS